MTRTQLVAMIRQSITDALARQNTAGVMRGVLETLVQGLPNEDDPSQVGSYLPPIAEDEYGEHPAAATGAEQVEYLYRRVASLAPVIIPAAPKTGVADDTGNTFSFDITPGYTSAAEYEYTEPNAAAGLVRLTGANSYINGTRVTITGLTGPIPAGQLKVRVAANGAVSAGYWLASTGAFTGTVGPTPTKATAPSFGAIDDVNNIVTLSSNYAYTETRWGIEGQGAQSLGANSICSPGNIAGRLFAYVVADGVARLQSDTVYSSAFSVAATANNKPTATISVVGGTSSVTPGESVTLQLDGADADAGDNVVKIEALDNGVKIGEITGASGALLTLGLTAGGHSFTARAYDTKSAFGLSAAVLVTAQNAATYNSILSINNTVADGMSFVPNGSEKLEFDTLTMSPSGPTVSVVFVAGGFSSYVDYNSEFGGKPYRFTDRTGVKYTGNFPTFDTTISY